MLKEKKLIQGKRVRAVLTVEGLEEINIKEVTSVEELTLLIEELNELKMMQQGLVTEEKEESKSEKAKKETEEKAKKEEEEKQIKDEMAAKRKQKEQEKAKKDEQEKAEKTKKEEREKSENAKKENEEKNKEREAKKQQKREEEMKTLLQDLEEIYPNKELESAEFRQEHLKLYNKASKLTKEKGISLSDFLEENGFKYMRKQRGVQKKES